MIPIETIQKFCADEVSRYHLHKPFSQDQWTFATNGHIAIRVPRMAEVPEVKGAPDCVKLFGPVFFAHTDRVWIDPPEPVIDERKCVECGGAGVVKICPECNGTYADDDAKFCKVCGDTMFVVCEKTDPKAELCIECEGNGVFRTGYVFVQGPKGEVKLASIYIELLHLLPNCKLGLVGDESQPPIKGSNDATCFRFDGGDGLLMGVRHP